MKLLVNTISTELTRTVCIVDSSFYDINFRGQYCYVCYTAHGMSGSVVYFSSRSRIIYGVHAKGYSTHNRATHITRSHFYKL